MAFNLIIRLKHSSINELGDILPKKQNKNFKQEKMKKITLLLLVLLLWSCKSENYLNKELSYNKTDKNGGTNFLIISIDENGNVNGTSGYNNEGQDSWEGNVEGKLDENIIKGKYTYEAEGETYSQSVVIKLFKDYVVFNEEKNAEIVMDLLSENNKLNSEMTEIENKNESSYRTITCNDEKVKKQVFQILKQNLNFITREMDEDNQYSLENIFTVEKNDELQSCGCEGTFVSENSFGIIVRPVNDGLRKTLNINYKAQINEDGEIIVKAEF